MTNKTECVELSSNLTYLDGALPNDEVHVWHADFAEVQGTNALCWLLEREEQDRASRFRVVASRDQFVISRAFLRLVLAGYLRIDPRDVRFHTNGHGKPELIGIRELEFNLSHTDGAAALAVTRTRAIGIDIERVRHDVETLDIADRFFSRIESDWLHSQPASKLAPSFFSCWTAKEAYIKARGIGLSMPLHAFTVIPSTPHNILEIKLCIEGARVSNFTIWSLELGRNLVGAVAVEGKGVRIRLGKWVWP
jgi:4'-phosphopantetheinyl transferase